MLIVDAEAGDVVCSMKRGTAAVELVAASMTWQL